MGWNTARWSAEHEAVWKDLTNPAYVYFVHSYYPEVQDTSLALCRTDYGVEFVSGIARPNLVAVQYLSLIHIVRWRLIERG